MPTDQYARATLSPRAVAERETGLPFALDWTTIADALLSFDKSRADECRATERYAIQGLRAKDRSAILTLRYPKTSGGVAVEDFFVKLSPQSAREADRHGQLVAAGVPQPRLVWRSERPDGQEVLGFEFLDTIGIDFASDQEVRELLTLLATLNSVPPSALGGSPRAPGGRPESEFTAMVRHALQTVESAGYLHWSSRSIDDWLALYRTAKGWAARMPTAVTHGEMYFQQVGRAGSGPLVIFDLATVGVRPRFADLASVFRGLAARGREEHHLMTLYLEALDNNRDIEPSAVQEAIDELRRLRILGAFQSLPWLSDSIDVPELGITALLENIDGLRHDLAALA